MLLFQLLDETLEELLLVCHFSNLGIDLHSDAFLHATLVHFVSTHLGIELHVTNRSEEQSSLVELVAELLGAFLFDDLSGVNFPVAEKLLRLVDVAPLVNPCHDNLFVAFSLAFHLSHFELLLSVDSVQGAQFVAFLSFHLFDSLCQNGSISFL